MGGQRCYQRVVGGDEGNGGIGTSIVHYSALMCVSSVATKANGGIGMLFALSMEGSVCCLRCQLYLITYTFHIFFWFLMFMIIPRLITFSIIYHFCQFYYYFICLPFLSILLLTTGGRVASSRIG
jgi:hypothetical protein